MKATICTRKGNYRQTHIYNGHCVRQPPPNIPNWQKNHRFHPVSDCHGQVPLYYTYRLLALFLGIANSNSRKAVGKASLPLPPPLLSLHTRATHLCFGQDPPPMGQQQRQLMREPFFFFPSIRLVHYSTEVCSLVDLQLCHCPSNLH